MPENPNPQGKGAVIVLNALNDHKFSCEVPPKQITQVEMELFTSMFVLQSDIKFNPVVRRSYWLYQHNDGYKLSLIAPEEWTRPYRGAFIGECVLQDDRTWTLALSSSMANDQSFLKMIEERRKRFMSSLDSAETLEEGLPEYDTTFSFYAKVLSYSLGRSLKHSMRLSGIHQLSYKQARGLLNHQKGE